MGFKVWFWSLLRRRLAIGFKKWESVTRLVGMIGGF
jgi:hypothetical protein